MTGGGGLLIESAPGQMRGLLYEAGQVVEAWHDFAHDPDLTGSVHRVRIDRVFDGQNRATARLADGTAISIRLSRMTGWPAVHLPLSPSLRPAAKTSRGRRCPARVLSVAISCFSRGRMALPPRRVWLCRQPVMSWRG